MPFIRETKVRTFGANQSDPFNRTALRWSFGGGEVQPDSHRQAKAVGSSSVRWVFKNAAAYRDVDLGAVATRDPKPLLTGFITINSFFAGNLEGNVGSPSYDQGVRAVPPNKSTVPIGPSLLVAEYWTIAGDTVIWRRVGFDLMVFRGRLKLRQWAGQGSRNGPTVSPSNLRHDAGDVYLGCKLTVTISEATTAGRTL
jgi:hypothetical protein